MKCDSWASLIRTFASPCFGREPKVRVATKFGYSKKPKIRVDNCNQLNQINHPTLVITLYGLTFMCIINLFYISKINFGAIKLIKKKVDLILCQNKNIQQ
jgi:hypothetical protein